MQPDQSMVFHYDFGDDWRFDVKLERIEPEGKKVKAARIIENHGKSPEQYPNSDWLAVHRRGGRPAGPVDRGGSPGSPGSGGC